MSEKHNEKKFLPLDDSQESQMSNGFELLKQIVPQNTKKTILDFDNNEMVAITEENGIRKKYRYRGLKSTWIKEETVVKQLSTKKDHVDDMMQLLKEGHTQKEIAEIFGVSQSYISKLKKDYSS